MTRRLAALLVPLMLFTHAPSAYAVGHWLMGGPVAALGALSQSRPDAPSVEPTASHAAPVSVAPLTQSDHRVNVQIQNGFARTEVLQTWANPNQTDSEATYLMPLPRHASLSELKITAGETVLAGEVRPTDEAERIYREEKEAGRDAGVAKKNDYRTFEFKVARVPAGKSVQVRFVYYQPVTVDTGVARYTYPIRHDDHPESGAAFWSGNVSAQAAVQFKATVRTAFPLEDVRTGAAGPRYSRNGPGDMQVEVTAVDNPDITVYYRLAKLPGRIEVIPYKSGARGTFMAVVTPGADLPLIQSGADHVFVLDVSGSMRERLAALVDGTAQAVGQLSGKDRFRIITFSDTVQDLTQGSWPATQENIQRGTQLLKGLTSGGGTNLFEALRAGLESAQEDRVTNVILVTDGVTNQGQLEPAEFRRLLTRADVRFHGFLMGNEANWPLMDTIAKASGGHYQSVVSSDEIAGVLRLAEGKLVSEAIHDVKLSIDGGDVTDTTQAPPRLYHGEQLVIFGRYQKPGPATFKLTARVAGRPYTYEAKVDFPAADARNPELERLYAIARCEEWKQLADAGLMNADESKRLIRDLGVEAQVVTDETSMVLLTDGQFATRGIHRANEARVQVEAQARVQRAAAPAPNYTATYTPPPSTYTPPVRENTYAPHVSHGYSRGGGAFDPLSGALVLALAALGLGRKEDE